jgi:ketosteroid isomerase-like protein
MTSTVGREGTPRRVAMPAMARYSIPHMSRENVELVKRLTELGSAGDLDGYFEFVADDVSGTDLRSPPDAPADFHNKQELREAWERFNDAFEDFTREVDEYVDVGDWVITVGRWTGTARGTGAHVHEFGVNATRIRGGKIVEALFSFQEKEAAIEAVRNR